MSEFQAELVGGSQGLDKSEEACAADRTDPLLPQSVTFVKIFLTPSTNSTSAKRRTTSMRLKLAPGGTRGRPRASADPSSVLSSTSRFI